MQTLIQNAMTGESGTTGGGFSSMDPTGMSSQFSSMTIWQEMLPGEDGALVSDLLCNEENGQYTY